MTKTCKMGRIPEKDAADFAVQDAAIFLRAFLWGGARAAWGWEGGWFLGYL